MTYVNLLKYILIVTIFVSGCTAYNQPVESISSSEYHFLDDAQVALNDLNIVSVSNTVSEIAEIYINHYSYIDSICADTTIGQLSNDGKTFQQTLKTSISNDMIIQFKLDKGTLFPGTITFNFYDSHNDLVASEEIYVVIENDRFYLSKLYISQ